MQDETRNTIREHFPNEQSEVAERVRFFMEQAGQPTMESPGDPGQATRKLAAELIIEEARETVEALGFRMALGVGGRTVLHETLGFDIEEAVDGCIDTIYVCHWALNAMGVADVLPMVEVLDANDRKLGPGHSFSESGKLLKPASWVGPDIRGALAAQMQLEGELDERE